MESKEKNILFYDGTCGLCHRSVTWLLKRDSDRLFVYSPLQGEKIKSLVVEDVRNALPDSIALFTKDSELLVKSTAVVFILKELGSVWRVLGYLLWIIPKPLRNLGYDIVAKIRNKLFKKPVDLCPVIPEDLSELFLS